METTTQTTKSRPAHQGPRSRCAHPRAELLRTPQFAAGEHFCPDCGWTVEFYDFDAEERGEFLPGGETKFGISLRWLRQQGLEVGDLDHDGDVDGQDVILITNEKAKKLYHDWFWHYDAVDEQLVANKVFDLAVNLGPTGAHRILQESINTISSIRVPVDGILGPATLEATNRAESDALLLDIRARQAAHYARLAMQDPASEKFILGWMRRSVA